MTDISRAMASLRRLRAEAEAGAIAGLTAAAPAYEQELAGTRVHGDETGATRASYRVYVVHEGDDGSNAATDGAAAADSLNPGHGVRGRHGSIGEDVLLVASVFTDYAEHLATDEGGAKDAVSPFIARYGPQIAQDAATGIKRRLGS
jgi:hypothetical protein